MPRSIGRGTWSSLVSMYAAASISIATLNSGHAGESIKSANQVGTGLVRNSNGRDSEYEDHSEYPGLTIVKTGTSTKAARKQAVSELPYEQISPEARQKCQAVVKNLGMFRRLPTVSFECDPTVYHYFLKNPDVAVSSWRAMEISQFQLQEVDPTHFRADAGDGSIGGVELLLRTPSETLIHCDGAFKSPLLPKPIIARSLMRVQTTFAKDRDGRIVGTHSGDVFVEFPSQTVEAIAKVIAPVSYGIADRNFKQMTLYVHLMSHAMAKRPDWIEVIGNKLEGLPEQKKLEFLEFGAQTYSDSQKRLMIAKGIKPFSPDDVLSPFRQWNTDGAGIGSTQLPARSNATRIVQNPDSPNGAAQQK